MKRFSALMLSLCVLLSLLLTSCGVGPVVKILKSINDEPSRFWIAFIKENGINAITEDGKTMLLAACDSGNVDLVKACIKSKADVNLTSKWGMFPITIAVHYQKNVEMAEVLLKAKASPRPREHEDMIIFAVSDNNLEMLQLLLKYVKNLDYSSSENGILRDDLEIIAALDRNGFKPSVFDLYTLSENFLAANDIDLSNRYLEFLSKYAQDPLYKDLEVSNRNSLMTYLYDNIYTDTPEDPRFEKVLTLFKIYLAQGYAFTGNYSPNKFVEKNCFNPRVSEFVDLFAEYGFDFNDSMHILTDLIQYTGSDQRFAYTSKLYNHLVSLGVNPLIPDDMGRIPAELYEEEEERYQNYLESRGSDYEYQLRNLSNTNERSLRRFVEDYNNSISKKDYSQAHAAATLLKQQGIDIQIID